MVRRTRRKKSYTSAEKVAYANRELELRREQIRTDEAKLRTLDSELARVESEVRKLELELQRRRGIFDRFWGEGSRMRDRRTRLRYEIASKRGEIQCTKQTVENCRVQLIHQEQIKADNEQMVQAEHRKLDRQARDRALLARAKDRDRELATTLRRRLNIDDACPYCGSGLSTKDAHLDHIHPISSGGLSIASNLVFVCSSCNIRKRDFTLNEFIDRFKLNREGIFVSLKRLHKRF